MGKFSWLGWLKRTPVASVIIINVAGKPPVEIKPTKRGDRWVPVAGVIKDTVEAGGVERVSKIDREGALIASVNDEGRDMTEETEEEDDTEEGENDETGGPFIRHMREWDRRLAERAYAEAAVLDRHGNFMMHAFREGVAASSSQQEHLVGLVETLTAHLSSAITSLHTVSVNFANTMANLTKRDDDDTTQVSQNSEMLTRVLGEAAARMMTGPPNGAPPGKKTTP